MKDDTSLQWAQELSKALTAWCKEEGKSPSQLAREIGISEGVWYSIMRRHAIARNTEVYARIFLRTGLESSDPQTLPPLKLIGTLSGQTAVRAWSQEKYKIWLQTKWAKRILKLKAEKQSVSKVKASPARLAVNTASSSNEGDELLTLVRKFKAEMLRTSSTNELMQALLRSLQSVLDGTSKERDTWFKYNREVLTELVPLLEILSQNSPNREHALQVLKRT